MLPTAIPKLGRYFLSVWDRFFATELGKSLASQTIWKLGAAPRAKEQPDFTTAAIENLYADLSEFGRVDQRNFGLIERALHLRTTKGCSYSYFDFPARNGRLYHISTLWIGGSEMLSLE